MEIKKISVSEKLSLFKDHWNLRIVGELNGRHVKLIKVQGAFDWHKHDAEDEMFFVVKGTFEMELRDKALSIDEGDYHYPQRGRAPTCC